MVSSPKPDFSFESKIESTCDGITCGVDEVGRGPLAGPVVASAVIIPPNSRSLPFIQELNDSKKISPQKRERLATLIEEHCLCAVSFVDERTIDHINILQAALMAMKQAVESLPQCPAHALIDGTNIPTNLTVPGTSVKKGDSRSLSIAAASILAKVKRDHYMRKLHQEFPHYSWDSNAGYGTKAHIDGMEKHGITPHHRLSFAPVDKIKSRSKY